MKNTFGNAIGVTLFGESHGKEIGVVLDGLCPGISIDEEEIRRRLDLRRPYGSISTQRREPNMFSIVSGTFEGKTTGTPLCILIPNTAANSADYDAMRFIARPGHADYTAYCKYHGYADPRGGGHFSGRLTAPLVAAGAVALSMLKRKGIDLGTHITRCAEIDDRDFDDIAADISELNAKRFAVLDEESGERMRDRIEKAAEEGDSVGGVLETAVSGMPAGVGEPWFDSLESMLSHALFSIPGVKGVEFGDGFMIADMRGSEANDPFRIRNGKPVTITNHNGGINGGITNGMPVIFRVAVKPTPSIFIKQDTVDFRKELETELNLSGRHDPAIVHRARAVVDALTALTLADCLTVRYGTDWWME